MRPQVRKVAFSGHMGFFSDDTGGVYPSQPAIGALFGQELAIEDGRAPFEDDVHLAIGESLRPFTDSLIFFLFGADRHRVIR